MVANHIWLLLV
jgi:hypothetical protein